MPETVGKQNAEGKQKAEGRAGKGIHRESPPRRRICDEMDQEGREACAKQEVQPLCRAKDEDCGAIRRDDSSCGNRVLSST